MGGLKLLHGPDITHRTLLRHFSEWGEVMLASVLRLLYPLSDDPGYEGESFA